MKTSYKGRASIAREEAIVLVVYDDGGTPAIGMGHNNKDLDPNKKITIEEALELFGQDIEKFETAVKKLFTKPLTQQQLDALVSFAYNLGAGTLARSSIPSQIEEGNLEGAMDTLEKYCRSRDAEGKLVPRKGLQERRAKERKIFLEGDYSEPIFINVYEGDPHTTKPTKMELPPLKNT